MKKGSLIFALCIMFAAGTALAKVPANDPSSGVGGTVELGMCPTDAYKLFEGGGGAIPDNTPGGLTIGPIVVPDDGSTFTDVVVDLDISHTWVGDLTVTLSYDSDCDGTTDASSELICRPMQADCDPGGSTFGCSADLVGTYRFSDGGGEELGTPTCVTPVPLGCYLPSSPLDVFDGLAKGGCFTLSVVDGAGGDTGDVGAVVIWTENDGGTPTEVVSWGHIKSQF